MKIRCYSFFIKFQKSISEKCFQNLHTYHLKLTTKKVRENKYLIFFIINVKIHREKYDFYIILLFIFLIRFIKKIFYCKNSYKLIYFIFYILYFIFYIKILKFKI